jgi:hypothetical protein
MTRCAYKDVLSSSDKGNYLGKAPLAASSANLHSGAHAVLTSYEKHC